VTEAEEILRIAAKGDGVTASGRFAWGAAPGDLLLPDGTIQQSQMRINITMIGELDGKATPRIEALHRLMKEFDSRAVLTPNIWGFLWGKEAYGAMLFATALTNESIADALADSRYRGVYIGLAREVLAVATARGVTPESFNGFDPAAYLPGAPEGAADKSLEDLVAFNRRSAKTHSGIWRDLAVRKRPTEVDAQLGIVVTLSREVAAGKTTPLLSRLVELIHDIENGARAQSIETLDELVATQTASDAVRV